MPDVMMDEPESQGEEDEQELQAQDEAYHRQYDNDNTWEHLQEDEHGMLRVDNLNEQRAKRQRLLTAAQSARIRKGMIRYVVLVIDLTRAASASDFRPNRLAVMLQVCRLFVRNFFDQNPLSQLAIVLMHNGVAERLTELSGSPEMHIRKLTGSLPTAAGDASLQNAMELVTDLLRPVPPYGHREVLIMFAGLSTCDPGNIFNAIKEVKENKIRISVVGVAAEVYICKRMCEETGGQYGVALNESNLEVLCMSHAPPPPAALTSVGAELVQMGFPQRSAEDPSAAAFVGSDVQLHSGSYSCPRCQARVPDLPCECHVCGLILISSPHLARSYHHLFPVAPFEELGRQTTADLARKAYAEQAQAAASGRPPETPHTLFCFACLKDLTSAAEAASAPPGGRRAVVPMILRCGVCGHIFCFECDSYIHESLHNCPGCECVNGGADAGTKEEVQ